jgi:hypothetical protein
MLNVYRHFFVLRKVSKEFDWNDEEYLFEFKRIWHFIALKINKMFF